ncbi:MAG: methylated-DNA--[protein]-cysteine S-methyltransferase [Gammaproteobacteria bacterium]|nr:methylated-DNA--[protein]-cysteine S-methyltransferase [Gammaproteobacteria bacterium]
MFEVLQVPEQRNYQAILVMPLGGCSRKLGVRIINGALTALDFLPDNSPARSPRDALTRRVVRQLQTYLTRPHKRFSLPLAPQGTPFQQRVWRALLQSKPGQPLTYGTLAKRLHTSARAVGNACRANPIPIIIPCHRVVSASGLGGYSGKTRGAALALKRRLLEHERREPSSGSGTF